MLKGPYLNSEYIGIFLDSKNPDTREILEGSPRLKDFIDDTSRVHFERLCGLLSAAGVTYEINDRLVRGLDYYSKTVFEWVTDKVGAQGTICAGGRFDNLIEQRDPVQTIWAAI